MAAARASSISAMPPLVMPWLTRKPSSVCTSTSKIALPIPRTSYFADVIDPSCLRRFTKGCGLPDRPRASKRRGGRDGASAARHPARFLFEHDPCRKTGTHFSGVMLYRARMIRSFLTVSSGTLASRLLGFVRDSLVAALLGAGPVADAFLAAFQLVNVVRRLLTEGGLNAALVPAWLRVREADGATAAAAFAGRILGTVSAALLAAAALLGLLMPLVVTALAPGFAGHDTLRMAVNDARLMLPYLAFAGPATVLLALLNAQGRFALTAFSPILFNIALIGVMVVLLFWRQDAAFAAPAIAATV